jgi:Sec-independent protein translocase protein TatA
VLNLSFLEILLIAVVAVIAFGPRLPQVAAEAAHFVGKMRRSLAELRRDTGIDREIEEARRSIEGAVPRRAYDVKSFARRELKKIEETVAAEPEERAEELPGDLPPDGPSDEPPASPG